MKKIFHLNQQSELTQLNESDYIKESVLQDLLASYPELIPSTGNDPSNTKLILVSKEMGIADSSSGSNRWSIDHFFLDNYGLPILVEVKRSSDTRIRREVIGQIFDYAAHATSYWEIEEIIDQFNNQGKESELEEFIAEETNFETPNQFWETVESNLSSGRVKMLIIADKIPTELKRVIEFLNEQLEPSEIYGIEITQYLSNDIRTLVPNVIGSTAKAETKKKIRNSTSKVIDKQEFQELLLKEHLVRKNRIDQLMDFLEKLEIIFNYTSGFGGRANMSLYVNSKRTGFASIGISGTIELKFDVLFKKFNSQKTDIEELLTRTNALQATAQRNNRPHVSFEIFDNNSELELLKNIFERITEILLRR